MKRRLQARPRGAALHRREAPCAGSAEAPWRGRHWAGVEGYWEGVEGFWGLEGNDIRVRKEIYQPIGLIGFRIWD